MKVEIVDATLDRVIDIVENLRPFEREAAKQLYENVENGFAARVARSMIARAGVVNGRTIAIWGVETTGVFSTEAYIWMLGSTQVEQHYITFLKHSKNEVSILQENFKSIVGVVVDDFEKSKKWLTWLGFKVEAFKPGVARFSWSA